jgi:hypothetical protein
LQRQQRQLVCDSNGNLIGSCRSCCALAVTGSCPCCRRQQRQLVNDSNGNTDTDTAASAVTTMPQSVVLRLGFFFEF